jgi:hypothetical protein
MSPGEIFKLKLESPSPQFPLLRAAARGKF